MFDPCVLGLTVSSTYKADATGRLFPVIRYTYYVGTHGPFTEEYFKGQDTDYKVQQDIQARVNQLRALGAVLT